MTHLSLVEVDDEGNSATWGAHVGEQEYGAPSSQATEDAAVRPHGTRR
jgi:hypothetical protein